MAAPMIPGAPRPNSNNPSARPPPNFNHPNFRGTPDSLADILHNLNINRPRVISNAVSRPPPFAQSQPFPAGPPFSRPGPPLSVQGRPVPGLPPSTLPPNIGAGRSAGQGMPPFGARPGPMAPGPQTSPAPSGMLPPTGGSPPSRVIGQPPTHLHQGARPSPFVSPPMPSSQVDPSATGPPNLMSNGPPQFASGHVSAAPRFPIMGVTSQPPTGPPSMTGTPTLTSPHGTSVHPFSDSSAAKAPLALSMHSQMPSLAASQATVPPPASPFGMPTWPVQSQPMAAPPPLAGAPQPPQMFGVPPSPLPNQSMTATISSIVGQAGAPMPGASKIDPNQIPRPVPYSSVILHDTHQGGQATIPPPATSDYIVKDTGNCSPRNIRCTINQIPCTVDLLSSSGMQLALLVQPLALPHPSEEAIQVVDFGESGPVRCSRCKAYINPFIQFVDLGRRFICNFCGFSDETPRDYHCNLGPDGRRRDADERPELCRGTVEFVATKEFMVREPMPAVYFFLIDVSKNAIQTGATAAVCNAISQVIGDLPFVLQQYENSLSRKLSEVVKHDKESKVFIPKIKAVQER